MPSAHVAYVIAGTVHNDRFTGAKVTATQHGRGGVVIVYDAAGNRVTTVVYGEMARVEINHGEASDG